MTSSNIETVVIKKYANRRLYNTSTSTYVTLENLAEMIKKGIEFNVYDAKSNEDITRSVLTQIIVEEEGKSGQNLLPVSFMRNLIGFYGDNMQWLVPKYLEHSMTSLTKNQDQIRTYFQSALGGMFPFGSALEQMGKQNMAMFERTMRMFSPFGSNGDSAAETAASGIQSAAQAASEMTRTASDSMRSVSSAGEESVSKTVNVAAKMGKSSFAAATEAVRSVASDMQDAAEEAAFTPSASIASMKRVTPMPTPETSKASSNVSGEEVQSKIAALQRQLSDLAKNKA